jgi:cell division protein FtsW (lipid II flippase)
MKDAPGTRDYDWWLLGILAAICALGVLEIYSATHGSSLAGRLSVSS